MYRWITPRPLHAWNATPAKECQELTRTNRQEATVGNDQAAHGGGVASEANTVFELQDEAVLDMQQQATVLHAMHVKRSAGLSKCQPNKRTEDAAVQGPHHARDGGGVQQRAGARDVVQALPGPQRPQ